MNWIRRNSVILILIVIALVIAAVASAVGYLVGERITVDKYLDATNVCRDLRS